MPFDFRKSTSRAASRVASRASPAASMLLIGSTTTTCGSNSRTALSMVARCISRPYIVARAAWKRSRPFATYGCEVDPDRAHVPLQLCRGLLEREEQAALAPAAGARRELGRQAGLAGAGRPRDEDARAPVVAAAQHPVERLDAGRDARRDTPCARAAAMVIGMTQMPSSSIRNGYSLVPCVVPRYFTIRSRRVERCSSTRWSSRITQSETYSSSPCRVSWPSPRSPVITVVTPRSFSQRNSRRSSARRIDVVREAAEERSRSCRAPRAWRRACRSRGRAGRRARRGRTRPSRRSRCARRARGRSASRLRALELREVEPERADVFGQLARGLLEGHEDAGLAESRRAAAPGTGARTASCRSRRSRRRAWAVPGEDLRP